MGRWRAAWLKLPLESVCIATTPNGCEARKALPKMGDGSTQLQEWVPWSVLTGTPRATLVELRALLRKYSRTSLLTACARLGIGFGFGPEAETAADFERTGFWAGLLLPPALIPKVFSFAKQGRPIFMQAQIRSLAAEVMRLPISASDGLETVPDQQIGELLLRAGEALYKPLVKVEGQMEQLANYVALFLPYYELNGPGDPIMSFLRFYIFLTINIPRLPQELRNFDVFALFEGEFGFSLTLYCEFIFAFINHAILERKNLTSTGRLDGALRKTWFQKTTLLVDQIEKMFATVSFGLNDLPDTKPSVGFADFEFLRDRPYFATDEALYCLDYEYAVAKLESGALWRVLRRLPEKKKEAYLGFWGNVFEDYVAWLFESYSNGQINVFYVSPLYDNDDKPICDAIVVCGTTAVLIEAKLGTCPAKVRYAGDYQTMQAYLEQKLVAGTDRPVGVAQLLAAVGRLTVGPTESIPAHLRGIKKFIPLIITKDEIGSSWVINNYVNKRFQEQLKPEWTAKHAVTSLVTMNVSSLERLMHALSSNALSDVLEQRIAENPELNLAFESACKHIPAGATMGLSRHVEIMKSLADEIVKDFGMTD